LTVASASPTAPSLFARLGASRVSVDLVVACLLGAIGFAVGSAYMRTFNRIGGVGDFGQPEFSAAVAQACGKGFVNLGYAATPELARFLSRESDTFSCSELAGVEGGELAVTQRLYRYLMSSVAMVWTVRGVSWSGLWPLFGALFATTIAAAYGLFRLGSGRALAILASLALVVSAIHLGRLPYLRDYAKAPFMLALILVMARMAVGPMAIERLVGYGAAFGIILGVGFGFRNDLLINVPAFLVVVFLCLPGKIVANLRLKAAVVSVAAFAFLAVAWPIVKGYGEGSNTGHVAVLGLTTPYDEWLGIRGSMYDWGYAYVDQFVADIITSYSYRVDGRSVQYFSKEYDRQAVAYLFRIARDFPADIVARAYGSVLKILEMPFAVGTYAYSIPYGATGRWVAAVYDWQIWLLQYVTGRGLFVTAIALMIIGARSTWAAVALLLFLLYYAGYPAIQFNVRHFFHLEFVGWWALAFVLQQAASWTWSAARALIDGGRSALRPALAARPLARLAAFVLAATTIVLGSLATLRAYQAPHVRSMLRAYQAAPKERLATTVSTEGEKTLIASPSLWNPLPAETAGMPVRARYIVADFSSSATCDAVQLPVKFRYWYQDKTSDFSRPMVLKLSRDGEPTRIFFPAYHDAAWSSAQGSMASFFDGIEVPRGYDGCMTGLYRIADLAQYPVLLDITFAPRWEEATPFQTLSAFEDANSADGPAFYTLPPDLLVTRAAFDPLPLEDVVERSHLVPERSPGTRWIVKGRPLVPRAPILRFRPRSVARDSVLMAEGEVYTGGVSFGLFVSGHRHASITVRRPGPFVVALAAPAHGDVEVAVANDIADWWPANRIGRRVGPFVEWIPGATLRTDLVLTRIGWWTRDEGRTDQAISQTQLSVTEE